MSLPGSCSSPPKLTIASMILCSFLFEAGAQPTVCNPQPEPTFTVFLPKVGLPPDDEGQGWVRPPVWQHYPDAAADSITVPNGRPIYALIVSGFGSNKNFDQLMVYNFARHLMAKGAYVHYAWWNNLLAPYMERPLHHIQSHPGGVSGEAIKDDFLTAADASNKAGPGEDYQFLADAKLFLSAIREHNPSAMIIVVGHSMGGGAVVHLGAQSSILIDLLAPIDACGNRNYPWSGPAALAPPVAPYANWTRWRVTRDRFLGFESLEFQGITAGCVAVGPWLKDINERNNSALCGGPLVVVYHDAPAVHFGNNIINLHYRYQKEFLFPFDYLQDYHFDHSRPPGGSTSQAEVPLTHELCGFPPQRCSDPGGWPNKLDLSSPCCQAGDGVGWPSDGHGEIIGYRGPLVSGGPVPLGVQVRTSPECGNCPNQTWPGRSQSSNGTWSNGDGAARKALLQALETLPAGAVWPHRPVNPDLCLVSPGLIQEFDTMNKPPTANAGVDQTVECAGPNGAQVVLNGSGTSDPDNDPLTYGWLWSSGSAQGVTPTVTLPKGTHCITLTVRDPSGHIARDVTTVVVADTTPPNLDVSLTPRLLWPVNHKMQTIHATVHAQDICGQVASLTLASIVSNQPDNGPGDGNTTGDISEAAFNTLDLSFKLRAERAGPARDRIYRVTYQATDDSGNRAEVSVDVIVPHDANSYKNWLRTLR